MTLPPDFKEANNMDNHFSKMSLKKYSTKSIGMDFSNQTNLRSLVQKGEAPDSENTKATIATRRPPISYCDIYGTDHPRCISCEKRCWDFYKENDTCHCDLECGKRGDCCEDYKKTCKIIYDTYCDIFGTDHPACISCEKRCGQAYKENDTCHCDLECGRRGNCCDDYKDLCQNTSNNDTCKGRCWKGYDPNASCQCNSLCRMHSNCCLDINLCPIGACEELCIRQNCTSTAPEENGKIQVEPKLSNLRSIIEELIHIGPTPTQKSDPNCAAQCWEHCEQKFANKGKKDEYLKKIIIWLYFQLQIRWRQLNLYKKCVKGQIKF